MTTKTKRLNKERGIVTNTEFAKTDTQFIDACQKAGIPPTKRQAGKYRRKVGKAYAFKAQA